MLISPLIEQIEPNARTVAIFQNPRSGSGAKKTRVEELVAKLQSHGFQTVCFDQFQALQDFVAQPHVRSELRLVVAAGGDGTINALVNLLPADVPLTILPLGTENLVAKHLGLKCDVDLLMQTIAAGQTVRLDVGRANEQLFLLMFGCGFDAEVVSRLHKARTGHITQWSYTKPICQAILNYRYPQFRITMTRDAETESRQIVARWAFINNFPRYARQICFTPAASANDGLFDLCAFQGRGFWNGLRYLFYVLFGKQGKLTDCVLEQGVNFKIENLAAEPVPYQLDGDPAGELPVTIQVIPHRARMCVPAN